MWRCNSCLSFSQPSQDVVKEMTQVSKDTLEKIDKARSEGLYHEVRIHFYVDRGGEEGREWGGLKMESLPKQVVFLKMSFCWEQDSSCPQAFSTS